MLRGHWIGVMLLLLLTATGVCVARATGQAGEPIYEPLKAGDWEVSTPKLQSLASESVAELFRKAERLTNLYALLIVKNGFLVAEGYFNGENVSAAHSVASVTKSYVSALTGIALRENALANVDQKMMEFFPEFEGEDVDPRKAAITLRQVLQMRSGYPWEEFSPYLHSLVTSSNWLPFIIEFPLSHDPGTEFGYSNLMAHVLGIILARATGSSLLAFAEEHLFGPTDVAVGYWPTDANGYHYGSGDIYLTARELARFGQLYLDNGVYKNTQVIPSEWVEDSLRAYSTGIYGDRLGSFFREIGYGYLWWSARAGRYRFSFAWGHGGNLVIVIRDLDMVIVTTADHLPGQFGDTAWQKERAVIDLVGEFVASLP